jgi:hypothetical protein
MKRKLQIGLILAASMATSYTFAQETVLASTEVKTETTPATEEEKKEKDEPTFTLSGSIDVYGRTALGTTNAYGAYGPSTSFADLKGFGLGMANLIASYGGEKVGFTADLVFGPRGQAAVFGTASGQAVINQMFAYVKLGEKTTLNLGQFNTFLGYEVISPAVNFHYSTSYLFSWGPFNHTGLRADFDLGNGLVAKAAIMNPTDIVEFNPVNTYTLGAQIGYTNEKGGIWVNALLGDQDGRINDNNKGTTLASAGTLSQIDVTTGWNLGEKFYLGFNTSMQTVAAGQEVDLTSGEIEKSDGDATSFFGVAVYPKLTLSESFALGVRAEMFSLKNGHLSDSSGPMLFGRDADGDGSVTAVTVTGNYKIAGLTIIPEVRFDTTSEDSFVDVEGDPSNSMMSALVAFVYKF